MPRCRLNLVKEGIILINILVKDLDGQVHEIQGREGDSLMEALRQHEWGVAAVCGGLCSCGTCHVYLDTEWQGKFQPAESDEQDLLNEFETTKDNSRLSCQLPLHASHDGVRLVIAPDE
jgi:2Fe-2S ferredoxin